MRISYKIYFIVLLCLCSFSVYSQINCSVPQPPVFTTVSVRPETGKTELNWTLSQSSGIAAYLVYVYKNENGIPRGDIVDTIWNPSATYYEFFNPAYKYDSVSYVVASYRLSGIPGLPGCPSPFSNILITIFTSVSLDTCNRKLNINWNSYSPEPLPVLNYSVLYSVNGGNYYELDVVSPETNSITLTDFTNDSEYCFVIRANLEGGKFSTSNSACIFTRMQKTPQWINADYATVNEDEEISLRFTIDPDSEISLFRLERKSGETGNYQQIAMITPDNSEPGKVSFTDKNADLNIINYYRLSAINNCNLQSGTSNIASNIVLNANGEGSSVRLSWNKYRTWLGSVSEYRLFMDTGNGFNEEAILGPTDTVYSVSIPDIMYRIKGGKVCFFVKAVEKSNPFGISGESNSEQACFQVDEVITVPNVFTPDGDSRNDLFRPVITFMPTDYHLIISNRQSRILFDTKDYTEAWDGSDNGNPLPEGVYLWILKVTSSSGKTYTRTGTVTLFKNR